MSLRLVARVALGYLAALSVHIGVWALFAPRSFYDDYPGFGRVWASVDGPYNEHLIRDVGALNLAFAVVVIAAAITLSKPLVITTAIAALVWGVPHLLYHLTTTDQYGAGDLLLSLGGLVLFAMLPVVLLTVLRPAYEAPAAR